MNQELKKFITDLISKMITAPISGLKYEMGVFSLTSDIYGSVYVRI